MHTRITLALILALAVLLAALAAPARASCWGRPCDDVIIPGEGQTTISLPMLSGEGPFMSCYFQPEPCPEEE